MNNWKENLGLFALLLVITFGGTIFLMAGGVAVQAATAAYVGFVFQYSPLLCLIGVGVIVRLIVRPPVRRYEMPKFDDKE